MISFRVWTESQRPSWNIARSLIMSVKPERAWERLIFPERDNRPVSQSLLLSSPVSARIYTWRKYTGNSFKTPVSETHPFCLLFSCRTESLFLPFSLRCPSALVPPSPLHHGGHSRAGFISGAEKPASHPGKQSFPSRRDENPPTGARACNKMSGAMPSNRQITRLIERIFHSGFRVQWGATSKPKLSWTTWERRGAKRGQAKEATENISSVYVTNFPTDVPRAPNIRLISPFFFYYCPNIRSPCKSGRIASSCFTSLCCSPRQNSSGSYSCSPPSILATFSLHEIESPSEISLQAELLVKGLSTEKWAYTRRSDQSVQQRRLENYLEAQVSLFFLVTMQFGGFFEKRCKILLLSLHQVIFHGGG